MALLLKKKLCSIFMVNLLILCVTKQESFQAEEKRDDATLETRVNEALLQDLRQNNVDISLRRKSFLEPIKSYEDIKRKVANLPSYPNIDDAAMSPVLHLSSSHKLRYYSSSDQSILSSLRTEDYSALQKNNLYHDTESETFTDRHLTSEDPHNIDRDNLSNEKIVNTAEATTSRQSIIPQLAHMSPSRPRKILPFPSTPSYQKDEIILFRNNLIDTISDSPHDFILTFKLYPFGTIGSLGSILRFTGSSNDCCFWSDRWLFLGFKPNSFEMRFVIGSQENGNNFIDRFGVQGDIWNDINITARRDKVILYINNINKGYLTNTNRPRGLPEVKVYAGDPFHQSANAKIRDLKLIRIGTIPKKTFNKSLNHPSLILSTSLISSKLSYPTFCTIASVFTYHPWPFIPSQTSWEIRDDNGNILFSRNPVVNVTETTDVCLHDGMYIFNISDTNGNGIDYEYYEYDDGYISSNDTYYKISIDGIVIKKGTVVGYYETVALYLPTILTPSTNPSFSHMPSLFPTMLSSRNPTLSHMPSLLPSMMPSLYCPISIIFINITTDDFPEETTWELLFDNKAIFSGGPYENQDSKYEFEACLNEGLHEFIIYDTYGDGILDNGSYMIRMNSEIVKQGGGSNDFKKSDRFSFLVQKPSHSPSKSKFPTMHPSSEPSLKPKKTEKPTDKPKNTKKPTYKPKKTKKPTDKPKKPKKKPTKKPKKKPKKDKRRKKKTKKDKRRKNKTKTDKATKKKTKTGKATKKKTKTDKAKR